MTNKKPRTTLQIQQMKKDGQPITMLTAYDATFARLIDDAGADMILVGDSLGMVIQGLDNTIPVTLDEMIYHAKAVSRGARNAHIVCDMPFMTYQGDKFEALKNVGRILKESGAQSVKLEGGRAITDTVAQLVNAGIPIVEGLERCISASSNELTRRTLSQGINLVQQGQELHYSLGRSGVFPKLVISMIKIGEETGQLSFMLEKLAIFYKRELESTVTSLTKAMEPAIVLVVAGIVGTIVIALYLPMFSLITNMRA